MLPIRALKHFSRRWRGLRSKQKRFYAEVGELLIALPYRGATRHLQLTVQLGHDGSI